MTAPPVPPRRWRAACPNCGAPVDFASAASPVAVCGYCRSTLARDGETLRRIGQVAELFDDHSPLQLGVTGRWQGAAFTLVGRLQMRYDGGAWNEWHALFDSGRSGWLSEDNGRHVVAFEAPPPPDLPPLAQLQVGGPLTLDGRRWTVASAQRARVGAAEGELPSPPRLDGEFQVVKLRNADGEVGTLDDSDPAGLHWAVGRSADLPDLALTGLREVADASVAARASACPHCGAALNIRLDSSRSVVCDACRAVVDLSAGVGGDLAFYLQENPAIDGAQPPLPLGATATLALGGAARRWQIVGYVERCELPADPEDDGVVWREYLLHHAGTGFTFLVDADDGWSWATPLTGAPEVRGDVALWQGTPYRKRYDYVGTITHVLGEFYWRLQRDERTFNTDYAAGTQRLNREQTRDEVAWSAGETIDAAVIAQAFGLTPAARATITRDASPFGSDGLSMPGLVIGGVLVLLLFLLVLRGCSDDECDPVRDSFGAQSAEYAQCRANRSGAVVVPRTGGGSFGGVGSGGGHK